MVGASQRLAGRQESCRDSWVCALTSKWQVGVLLWEHRGWILRMTSLYKGQTVCRMQAIRHENLSGFLQNSDRKPVGLPFRLKELRTFACFPLIKECSISPCKAEGFAQPRAVGLPTCEALQGFTPTQKWGRHFCRQQTTFAALRSPALSRTGNVSQAFHLWSFCILTFFHL